MDKTDTASVLTERKLECGGKASSMSAHEKGDGKQRRPSSHSDVGGIGISDKVISEVICEQ